MLPLLFCSISARFSEIHIVCNGGTDRGTAASDGQNDEKRENSDFKRHLLRKKLSFEY